MVQTSCTMQLHAGPYLGTYCARAVLLLTAKTDQNLHICISLKGRERFSWGIRSHSCHCELLTLVVATCVETITVLRKRAGRQIMIFIMCYVNSCKGVHTCTIWEQDVNSFIAQGDAQTPRFAIYWGEPERASPM